MYEQIIYEVDDPVAVITLNRPQAMNAWTGQMEREFRDAVAAAEADRSVVGIVITGAGRGFCAGADLNILSDLASEGAGRSNSADQPPSDSGSNAGSVSEPEDAPDDFGSTYTFLLGTTKPVIAAINGPVAGMALPMIMSCDLRFMAESAVIISAFSQRGLVAEWGISWLLPRLVGPAVALDVLLSSRRIGGPEAAELGLVNRCVSDDELLEVATDYVRDLAANSSPTSMAIIKRQVYSQLHRGLGAAELESQRLMVESFSSPDFGEGVKAFMEKRAPQFDRLPLE